ncbi:type I-E CRISPR-associated protein Cse1/CasA [Synechococcus sp. WH 8016]|uniref:type I-E CRISPR-associated protein Cse1/CasA n=1 Tax=Synechococcus sp. WH 8016 TaxID=166318 RepID=UPI00022D7D98|nr:type I-E CRISPR-associated protein Cse1/CasA [Synechococcus sp. WH 8016]EHA63804.1 hypothetical protein Syn8016DRAFT_0845 [Synechococcus sp. WH 8016]
MTMTHNNLVSDPWVAALYTDGKNRYVSLETLFTDWNQIADITGVDGMSTLCIMHFLKIILMRVSGGVANVADVRALLDSNDLQQNVLQYLAENKDLFNVRDETKPFLQIAEIGTLKASNGSMLCQPENLNALLITGKTEKDLLFGYQYLIDDVPPFEFIDIAQFLLREAFAGKYGRCSSLSSSKVDEMRKLGQSKFEANASKSLLPNRTHVVAKLPTLRETIIVNLPKCLVDETEVAPWEKSRRPFPVTVTPDNEFQLLSTLSKSTLILWNGDAPYKVFSGPSEKIQREWIDDTLPLRNDLLQSCPRITAANVLKFLSPSNKSSDWSDMRTIFETLGHSSIQPAPITEHWQDLRDAGLMPESIGYEVLGVVMAGLNNPAIASVTQASMTVPSNVFEQGLVSKNLLGLLAFISRINREAFLPGYDDSNEKGDKKKRLLNKRPLNLLNQFARWAKPGLGSGDALKTRYPLSEQYLGLSQPLFEEAVQWIIDNPNAGLVAVSDKFKSLKKRTLDIALGLWNQTLGTLPLTTIGYVQAVGHANAKFQFIKRKLEEEINGTR